MTPSDAELLARTAAGEREAFDRFVERHQTAVLRLLQAGARSTADAEDALQDAFVAAWRNAGTYRGAGVARGWMLTIARRALQRRYRRRVGEPVRYTALDDLGAEAGWGTAEPPDVLYDRLEDRALLARALARLAPEDREVLVLRDLEELSGEDTAAALDLTLPAMKSRLHRARLRLAAQLRGATRAAT